MSKNRMGSENRNLIIILVTLCVIALVLVGVVVVNTVNELKEDETSKVADGNDEMEDGIVTEEDEEIEEILSEKYDLVYMEVQQLLNQSNINVDKINELYNSLIDESKELGRLDYAVMLIMTRNEDFLSKNLKQEALDALLNTDLSIYTETDRYRLYTLVIDLAKELGNNEVLAEYRALRDTVKDAYLEDCNSTLQTAIENGDYEEEDGATCEVDE